MNYAKTCLIVLVAISGSCATMQSVSPPDPSDVDAKESLEGPALIGSLRFRNHTVHMYTGGYTVENADGKVIARLINRHELQALLPEFFGYQHPIYADLPRSPMYFDNHSQDALNAIQELHVIYSEGNPGEAPISTSWQPFDPTEPRP